MLNIDNYGILNGTLKTNPIIKNNKDGSKKIVLTVMISETYRTADGTRPTYPIRCEAYVPASRAKTDEGPYALLQEGDSVIIEYTLKNKTWNTHEQGEAVLTPQIDTIKFDSVKNKEIRELYNMKNQLEAAMSERGVATITELLQNPAVKHNEPSAPADDTQLVFSDEELDI